MVWSEPMLKVAARFGVSSSYMARVCAQLNVPRPERGYWAKLAVGKAPDQPPLPEARPGDEVFWVRDGSSTHRPRELPKPPERKLRQKISVPTLIPEKHALIDGSKPLFQEGRTGWNSKYLKPRKKLLVDLAVTEAGLEKALAFANELFLALEERDHRVVIAPNAEYFRRPSVDAREVPGKGRPLDDLWTPMRSTVVYIGTVAIGLTIIEMSEQAEATYVDGEYVRLSKAPPRRRNRYFMDYDWTTTHDFPTNRLRLQAYSPYQRTDWSMQWQEKPNRTLSASIPTIIKQLEKATIEIAQQVKEGERQAELEEQRWEAMQEEWRQRDEERRIARTLADSQKELLQIIDNWAAAKRLEEFFIDAEARTRDLPDDQRKHMAERLMRARKLIDSTDALEQFGLWRAPEER